MRIIIMRLLRFYFLYVFKMSAAVLWRREILLFIFFFKLTFFRWTLIARWFYFFLNFFKSNNSNKLPSFRVIKMYLYYIGTVYKDDRRYKNGFTDI